MLKSLVVAGTTALMISSVGLAHAQSGPKGPGPRISAEDTAALADARIAGLKAGLKLTEEQEKNWPAVEAAIRALSKDRADRRTERWQAQREARDERRKAWQERRESRNERRDAEERREARQDERQRQRPDMIERMRRGADAMTTRAATMTRFADAVEPLYESLDSDQKRRFAILMRAGRQLETGHGQHRGRGGPGAR